MKFNDFINILTSLAFQHLSYLVWTWTNVCINLYTGTRDIIKDDRSILKDMDSKMESNLANLVMATRKVEEHLKYGGGVQYFMLLVVFCVWVFMVIIISTVPKLNYWSYYTFYKSRLAFKFEKNYEEHYGSCTFRTNWKMNESHSEWKNGSWSHCFVLRFVRSIQRK